MKGIFKIILIVLGTILILVALYALFVGGIYTSYDYSHSIVGKQIIIKKPMFRTSPIPDNYVVIGKGLSSKFDSLITLTETQSGKGISSVEKIQIGKKFTFTAILYVKSFGLLHSIFDNSGIFHIVEDMNGEISVAIFINGRDDYELINN